MPSRQDDFGHVTNISDRRQYSRRITGVHYINLGDSNGGIILNISEDGLAFTAAEVIVDEFVPRPRFQLADNAKWIEASGRIVWLNDSKKGGGIQFVDIEEEDRKQIRRWISSKTSSAEIQYPTRTARKIPTGTEIAPLTMSRNDGREIETLGEIHDPQFREMFPSESAPKRKASEPTAVPPPPPIPQAMEPAAAPPPPSPIPQTNRAQETGLVGHPLPVPNFGYQTREDWTDWIDPAATVRRSKVRRVVLDVLLTATAFAIGMALGHGSFEGLLKRARRLMPDQIQPAPSVVTPPADSAAAKPSPSAVDPSARSQDADTSIHPPETSASPNPGVPPGRKEETRATETPFDTAGASRTAKSEPPIPEEDHAAILIAAPGQGDRPFRLSVPETAVSASSSVAISSQTTILVPPEPGPKSSHRPKRLQPGVLIFHVEPQYPSGLDQKEIVIVKLHATVGKNGQVIDVQRISGRMPVASAAMSAIREWRYSPTLFNGHPVKTEVKITIAFRAR